MMAHPFAGQVRSGSRAKFRSMVGRSSGGQMYAGETQISRSSSPSADMRVSGGTSTPRADRYKRGGAVKDVNVNIIMAGKENGPPPLPPLPPPGALPPPGPALAGAGPPPGPPLMRKS